MLVDPITKSCVDTSYQSATVSGSHLEVGVKKNCTGRCCSYYKDSFSWRLEKLTGI